VEKITPAPESSRAARFPALLRKHVFGNRASGFYSHRVDFVFAAGRTLRQVARGAVPKIRAQVLPRRGVGGGFLMLQRPLLFGRVKKMKGSVLEK